VDFEGEEGNYSKTVFRWMREMECIQKGVKLKALEEGMELSGLVHAPIGMDKEKLEEKLKAHDITMARCGHNNEKTLEDLAAELVRGECILTADKSGAPMRLVDVVLLKIDGPMRISSIRHGVH